MKKISSVKSPLVFVFKPRFSLTIAVASHTKAHVFILRVKVFGSISPRDIVISVT